MQTLNGHLNTFFEARRRTVAKSRNLTEIQRDKIYKVAGFVNDSTDYAEKLYKMGFIEGTPVELAPVNLSDPME